MVIYLIKGNRLVSMILITKDLIMGIKLFNKNNNLKYKIIFLI